MRTEDWKWIGDTGREIALRSAAADEAEINRLMGARDEARDRACQAEEEIDRLNNVITEQAAEIRGLQEEAADYRNQIKSLEAFINAGEGI